MEENSPIIVADDLNEDCLLEIFSYLSINDMMHVKNVCKKWRQTSQQWFKQVQTVEFESYRAELLEWKIYAKYFKRKLGSGPDIKKLIPILKLFGHHIKYYYLNYSKSTDIGKNEEWENLSFNLFPTLCKNIVDANIYSESYPTWNISVIAKHWKQLEKFNFKFFDSSCEENMCELLHNNQQLKIFSLAYDTKGPISDRFLTHLPTRIEEIDIEIRNKEEKLTYFVSTIKNFTSLSSLRLSGVFFLSDAEGAAIGNLSSLKYLALRYIMNYESRSTIIPIANLENLKSLKLSDNKDLDEDNLINIVNSCKQLEQLEIFSKILTDEGMTAISKLKKLKILAIDARFVSSNSIINLCDNLEVFICHNSKMNNNDAIKLLEKATNLWFVDFSVCAHLTQDFVKAANEIANERKRNILHMILGDESNDSIDISDDVHTPYFICTWAGYDSFSLNLLPNYIADYVEKCDIY